MVNRPTPRIGIVTLLLLSALIQPLANADTVIRSDQIDLFPAGTFDDESQWETTTQFGFNSGEIAHWTEAMVADGHLSITHDRPLNMDSVTIWSSYSPTWDNYSLGAPDGGYSWSKGPEMEVTDFDVLGYTNNPLLNASLLVSFAIPDTLQDDEVRFELDWDGNIHLLHKFAHTPAPVDNMQGNPLELSLDGIDNWTWTDLSNLLVTVDYVSVGGLDDSEVRLDAVGIKFTYQGFWSGLDSAKSVNTTTMAMSPFVNFSLQEGAQNSIVTTSCGLEPLTGETGSWLTTATELPHDQTWGRIHLYGNASASIKIQTSSDGSNWSSGVAYNDGSLISGERFVRAEIEIFDGCVSGLRIDFNDPTIFILGNINGDVAGLSSNFSYLSFAIGTHLLTTTPMTSGQFSFSLPVGRYLPDSGNELTIGMSARFQWSSDGSPETVVAVVDDIIMTGGFVVEWDLDPICERPSDVYLDEDGIGSVVQFLNSCSDDITATESLVVNVNSHDSTLVSVSYEDGQLLFSQQPEVSGITAMTIDVYDERGNLWTTTFDVVVSSVDDPPTHATLPLEVLAPVGQTVSIPLDLQDIDTPIGQLSVSSDTSWVTVDEFGALAFAPLSPGTFDVEITISDGTSSISQQITVLATSDPDLTVESVDFDSEKMVAGSVVSFDVYVRNDGLAAASMVVVRCYNGETLIDSANISHIPAGSLASTSCHWQLPTTSGNTSLRVYVDPTHDILEISETNNEYASSIEILEPEAESSGDGESSGIEVSANTVWLIVGIVILFGIVALQLAPGRVRRNL